MLASVCLLILTTSPPHGAPKTANCISSNDTIAKVVLGQPCGCVIPVGETGSCWESTSSNELTSSLAAACILGVMWPWNHAARSQNVHSNQDILRLRYCTPGYQ